MFEPKIGAVPETVHRAVEMNGRDDLMRSQDIVHDFQIGISRGAFIVNDDVVTVRPIRIVVKRQRRGGGAIIGPDDIDLYIGSFLDAFNEHFVLMGVVVAASAGHQQGLEPGFGSLRRGREARDETNGQHDAGDQMKLSAIHDDENMPGKPLFVQESFLLTKGSGLISKLQQPLSGLIPQRKIAEGPSGAVVFEW